MKKLSKMATLLGLPGKILDYKHQPSGEMSIYIIR